LVAETSEVTGNVYVIKEAEAIKINMDSNPTLYYVGADGRVVMAAYGMPMQKDGASLLMQEAKRRFDLADL